MRIEKRCRTSIVPGTSGRNALFTLAACFLAAALGAFAVPSRAAVSEEEMAALNDGKKAPGSQVGESAARVVGGWGKSARLDGLEKLIEIRSPQLINVYRSSLSSSPIYGDKGDDRPMEVEALEAVVLKGAKDEELADSLYSLFTEVRYRSKAVFDRLRARTSQPAWAPDERYAALLNTGKREFAEPLFAMRASMPPSQRQAFVKTMVRLDYRPAQAFFEELLVGLPPGSQQLSAELARALIAMDSAFPPRSFIARFAKLGAKPSTSAKFAESASMLNELADTKTERTLDYPKLRSALPDPLPVELEPALVRVIMVHHPKQAERDLVAAIRRGSSSSATAVSIAAGTADPALWRDALAAAQDAAQANASVKNSLAKSIADLEARLANPAQGVAEIEKQDTANRYNRTEGAVAGRLAAIIGKARPSAADTIEAQRLLDEWERAIGTLPEQRRESQRGALAVRRFQLALWVRFRQGDPRGAIGQLEVLAKAGMLAAKVAIADTLQFDLGDKAGALAKFESLAAESRAGTARDVNGLAVTQSYAVAWFDSEVAFLKGGKRFSGTVTRDTTIEFGIAMQWLWGVGLEGFLPVRPPVEESEIRKREEELRTAAPSRFSLVTLNALSAMPGIGDLSELLLRNDPSGFLGAQLVGRSLAMNEMAKTRGKRGAPQKDAGGVEKAGPAIGNSAIPASEFREPAEGPALTAQALEKRTGVRFALSADPRYATPERTWSVLMGALRKGDRDAALACFASPGPGREKWGPVIASLTPEQMREMADVVKEFKVASGFGEFVEAYAIRPDGRAGPVTLHQEGGEWKIVDM
jgi:hypothetical protein